MNFSHVAPRDLHFSAFILYTYVPMHTLPQRNTYQGVVITDGTRSYAVFIYNCALLDMHSFGGIGYYFSSALQIEHRLSNTNMSSTIACGNSPGSPWSTVVYPLFGKKLLRCGISRQVCISSRTTHPLSLDNANYLSFCLSVHLSVRD